MLRENSAASQLSKQSQASTRPLLNVWADDGRPARSFARPLGQRQQQQYTTILLHSHTKLSPTHALCACITARRVLAESESLVIRHTWGPSGLLSVKTSPQRRADVTDEFAPVTWDVMAQSTKLLILCDSQRFPPRDNNPRTLLCERDVLTLQVLSCRQWLVVGVWAYNRSKRVVVCHQLVNRWVCVFESHLLNTVVEKPFLWRYSIAKTTEIEHLTYYGLKA